MPKKDVSLVVCDIDNTISDTFNLWGEALDKAVDDLAALHKTDRKTMEETLLAAVPENNRGSSGPLLGINIRADIAQTPALQGNTPEEKAFFEKNTKKSFITGKKNAMKPSCSRASCPSSKKSKPPAQNSSCTPMRANRDVCPDWQSWESTPT